MNQSFARPVFYVPATGQLVPTFIDEAITGPCGGYIGRYGGKTLEQVSLLYPGAVIGELDEYIKTKEAMMSTEPTEISDVSYADAQGMLPPLDFQQNHMGTSFKCEERLSGRITAIYATVRGRYFTFNGLDTTTHATIMEMVTSSMAVVSA